MINIWVRQAAGPLAAFPTLYLLIFSCENALVSVSVFHVCSQKRILRSLSFGLKEQTPERSK